MAEGPSVLEVLNLTPYTLTHMHVRRSGEPDEARQNMLRGDLPPNRGMLVGRLTPGQYRLTYRLERGEDGAPSRHDDYRELSEEIDLDDVASVEVRYDAGRGMHARQGVARRADLAPRAVGGGTASYTWSKVEGGGGKS